MTTQKITIPDVGDFDSVEVVEVLVAEGDTVAVDDSLLALESDKATMEIPAPFSGVITKVSVAVGENVKEGSYVFDIEVTADSSTLPVGSDKKSTAEMIKQESPEIKATESPVKTPSTTQDVATPLISKPVNAQSMGAKSHASPSVRAFARKLGVELEQVTGTGHKGRIKQADIELVVKEVMQGGGHASSAISAVSGAGIPPIPSMPTIDFSQFGKIATEELGRVKKIAGKFLHASWLNIPHVTQFDECDITEMDKFRKDQKAIAEKQGMKLTPLVFVMKAVVKALQDYPNFNASLSSDGKSIIKKGYYSIGIAVDTPNGLMVPVVKDVDKKGVYELSRDLMAISAKAREGKLSASDMSGGTFTISSLGGIGGTQFTPIINAPEVAIMGLSRAKMQPVWNGAEFIPRLIMPYSVSYDHRAIDGAEGCRFTTQVGKYLSDLRQLIL